MNSSFLDDDSWEIEFTSDTLLSLEDGSFSVKMDPDETGEYPPGVLAKVRAACRNI